MHLSSLSRFAFDWWQKFSLGGVQRSEGLVKLEDAGFDLRILSSISKASN